MREWMMEGSLFWMFLTIGCFLLASFCQKKWKLVVLNPLIVASAVIICFLKATDIPFATYEKGCQALQFFLTPATICLAISLYEQLQELKGRLAAIVAGVIFGTAASLGTILLLSSAFHLNYALTISLLPKSVTTAIGMSLSQAAGGIPSITTAVIIITGVLGNILGPLLCKIFKLTDSLSQGVALGTSSHVIGTTRAAQMSELAGAVSSLSLTVAGLLTAIVFAFL